MANDYQKLVNVLREENKSLQRQVDLLEEIVAAKNELIQGQKKVLLHQKAQIDDLTGLLNQVLDITKKSGEIVCHD